MKTTLNISDPVMAALRREAATRGCTMSELVETALRRLLEAKPAATDLPPLPSFHLGPELVDIANREALYDAMDAYDAEHKDET